MRLRALALALITLATAALPGQETDALVRQGLVALLTGDEATLREVRAGVVRVDAERSARGESRLGLEDDLMAAHAAVAMRGQPSSADALRDAAAVSGTREERRLLRQLASEQPWETIKRLRWELRFNRFASVFNWFFGRLSQVLTGQTQALAQMGVDVAFSYEAFLYPAPRERKILALTERLEVSAPDAKETLQAERWAQRIEVKLERQRRRDMERRVRLAKQRQEWELMLALAEGGLAVWPEDEDFEKWRRDADHRLALRARGWLRSLTVLPLGEERLDEIDWSALGDEIRQTLDSESPPPLTSLLGSWAVGQSEILRVDAAILAASVAGDHGSAEEAQRILTEIGPEAGTRSWLVEGMRTAIPIAPTADLEAAREHRRDLTRHSALTGAREVDDSLYIASSSAITQGLRAPEALGVFFFVDSTIRAIALSFHNPLGADGVLDALARLERREGYLTVPQREEQRDRLSERGRFAEAISAQRQIDPQDTKEIRRLQERWGRGLLAAASETDSLETQRRLLRLVLDECQGTRSAGRAWRQLQSLPAEGVGLTRAEAEANAVALAAVGFPAPASLWDGDPLNGEIEEEGFWLDEEGTLHWRLEGSRQEVAVPLSDDQRPRIGATMRAIAESRRRDEAILARMRPNVPLGLSGGFGSSGLQAAPQLQRFRFIDGDLPLYQ